MSQLSHILQAINGLLKTYSQALQRQWLLILWLSMINVLFDLLSFLMLLPLLLVFFDAKQLEKIPQIGQVNLSELLLEPSDKFYAVVFVFVIFILKTIFSVFIVSKRARFTTKVSQKLSHISLAHSFSFVDPDREDDSTGKVVQQVVEAPNLFAFQLVSGSFEFPAQVLMVLIICTGLLFYKTSIFMVMIVVLSPGVLAYGLYAKKKTKGIKSTLNQAYPKLVQRVVEAFQGKLEIIVSATQEKFIKRFESANSAYHQATAKLLSFTNASQKIMELVAVLGVCLLFTYLAIFDKNEGEAIIVLSIFTISAFRLIPTINAIFLSTTKLRVNAYVLDILNTRFSNAGVIGEEKITEVKDFRSLAFHEVNFSYRNSDFIISGINFNLEKGEKLVIHGPSGSGKTTLIHLLLGLLTVDTGQITVNDKVMNHSALKHFHKHIAYIPQSAFIFEGSFVENISMGLPVNEEKGRFINQLIRELDLSDMVEELGGLHAQLKENGSNISAGQKQRIGILRALCQQKPLLICDEITSNLDKGNRDLVLETLSNLLRDNSQTIVIITHDEQVISKSDRTLFMESGRIKTQQSPLIS